MKTQFQKQALQKQQQSNQNVFNYHDLFPQEQNYFAQELFQIAERYIPTSYGQIYSVTAGSPGQPLILVVHGSGPKNSSSQYRHLLQQYLVRISYMEKFYIVAIDCPGYGKSVGSKQAVKTFPTQMFQQILKGLNYKQYFAMYGHSQGGAAIFNALYDNNSMAQILIMDRPVCGNIQRFRKFNVPTLLIYDLEDDGHPIWQGKLLYKQLSYTELYTYKSSQDMYWVPDNIWNRMLDFFSKYANNRKGRTNIFTKMRPISMSPQIKHRHQKQKSNKQQKTTQKSIKPKQKAQKARIPQKSLSQSLSKQRKPHSLDLRSQVRQRNKNHFKKQLNLQQVEQLYLQNQQLLSLSSNKLSDEQRHELQKLQQEMRLKEQQLLKNQIPFFMDAQTKQYCLPKKSVKARQIDQNLLVQKKTQDLQTKPEIKLKQPVQEQKIQPSQQQKLVNTKINIVLSEEQEKNRCSICYDTYYRPLQTNCNHIFCTKCILQSLLIDVRCPLCRGNITKKTQKKQLQQQILSKMNKSQVQKRQKAYLKLKLMLDSIVMIEIGNRSIELETKKSHFSKTKKKYMWQIFVKETTNFKFDEVSFDVNMGNSQSKPVKLKNGPFVFQSRGTFSFSCQIVIKPRNKEYAPLKSIYRIDIQPGTHRKTVAFRKKVYMKQ